MKSGAVSAREIAQNGDRCDEGDREQKSSCCKRVDFESIEPGLDRGGDGRPVAC